MKRIAELLANERGSTAVEYAAIASLISVVAIGAIATIGRELDAMFGAILSAF